MDNSWLYNRGRAVHMTIRDIDCADFDVERFILELKDMEVTFFSFFVGGYITTYPTKLEFQRVSPYLGDVDLTRELVETAHKYGIKTLAMIDLGQLPKHAGDANPDWCAQDSDGNPIVIEDRLYATCPNSKFRKEYAIEMVSEIIGTYDVDCIKFGGGSYGFSKSICYCDRCKEQYREFSGKELPTERNWSDAQYKKFFSWQLTKTAATVQYLVDMVKTIKPDMPVMGNSVCFGDPNWTIGAALDMEVLASIQDAVQVEVQSRVHANFDSEEWQSLTWPSETANFMTHATDKPVWVVASYFLAWPWRRNAMPYAEQKVYYAQMIANGATPMLNLSGGPMAVHEDKRGFKAIKEIYGFHKDNHEYYINDKSDANVAIIYSKNTMVYMGNDEAMSRYIKCIRGFEDILNEGHVPFDLISLGQLDESMVNKYTVVILPNVACMTEDEAEVIRNFVKLGGKIISTFETSLNDDMGNKRDNYLLDEVFGLDYKKTAKTDAIKTGAYSQAYMEMNRNIDCRLFNGLEGTKVIPADGYYCSSVVNDCAKVPLTLGAPFQVFPEGFAYPMTEKSNDPMMVVNEYYRGESIYFATALGKNYEQLHFPDFKKLVLNSLDYLCSKLIPIITDGPNTLLISLRRQENRSLVHLINLTGGKRFFDSLIPLHNIMIGVYTQSRKLIRAYTLLDKKELDVNYRDGYAIINYDKLLDYDVIVFDWK